MFYECSVCKHQYFEDIPKKPHTVEVVKGYAATCLKSGKTDGKRCSVCKMVIVAQSPITIKQHNIHPKTINATYFAKGSRTSVCVNCDLKLSNIEIKKLVLKTPKIKVVKGKKQIRVKYTKVKDATGFQVRYKNGKGKWVVKTFKTKKTATKVIKKLKKGTYKVQVRAMITKGKLKAYSNWTKSKKVKVK